MNWTDKTPTAQGFYAWKLDEQSQPVLVLVSKRTSIAGGEGLFAELADGSWGRLHKRGLWLRLVPAEEVEKAFNEGWGEGADANLGGSKIGWDMLPDDWNRSRARKVAEGEEP